MGVVRTGKKGEKGGKMGAKGGKRARGQKKKGGRGHPKKTLLKKLLGIAKKNSAKATHLLTETRNRVKALTRGAKSKMAERAKSCSKIKLKKI